MDPKVTQSIQDFMKDAQATGLSAGAIAVMATGMVVAAVVELLDCPPNLVEAVKIAMEARTQAETLYILTQEPDVDKEALADALTKALRTLGDEDDDELPLRF